MAAVPKRSQMLDAVAQYVEARGGWILSPIGAHVLRVEVSSPSSLPSKLIELGYSVHHCGSNSRIVANGHSPFKRTEIIEITL